MLSARLAARSRPLLRVQRALSSEAPDVRGAIALEVPQGTQATERLAELLERPESAWEARTFVQMQTAKHKYHKLLEMYHKGEISIEESASRVGFELPEAGVYPDDGLLASPNTGGVRAFKNEQDKQ